VKKYLGLALVAVIMTAAISLVACSKPVATDNLVGTWGMNGDAAKTIKISKEGANYFYEGSQGKTPAQKQDDNTLLVPMGPIQVTVKYDPAAKTLGVSFMGENYIYKKVK
jgi:hypothetical protein